MVNGQVTLNGVILTDMVMILGQANKVGLNLNAAAWTGSNFSGVSLAWTDAASLNALSQLLHNLSLTP